MLGELLMAVVRFLAWLFGRLCDLVVLAVELVVTLWTFIMLVVVYGINVILALAAVYVLLKLMVAA